MKERKGRKKRKEGRNKVIRKGDRTKYKEKQGQKVMKSQKVKRKDNERKKRKERKTTRRGKLTRRINNKLKLI